MADHTTGCRCLDCEPGLLQLARLHCKTAADHQAMDAMLAMLQPSVRRESALALVEQPKGCDHGMTGTCTDCVNARTSQVRQKVRQPWEPRKAA